MVEIVAFFFGILILSVGFKFAAFAFSGGERSGLHRLAPVVKVINDEELLQLVELELNQETENKAIKQHKLNQMANYVLSIASLFELVALLVGAFLA